MTITCAKCHHLRELHEQAPSWQCPACGVAYAKAADSRGPAVLNNRTAPIRPERRTAWTRWLGFAAIAYGAYAGIKTVLKRQGGSDGLSSFAGKFGTGSTSSDDLRILAAATAQADVVIYSTSWCPNCKAAKQWMSAQGFAFTECDVEKSASCAAELQAHYGSSGDQGVPYLVVRGHHMKDGFDSDEFIAALKGRGG
jgi:glutaredoxin